MSGEDSKRSGELGESMAARLLKLIGWHQSLSSIAVPCAFQDMHGARSHGNDRMFVYNSPFSDSVTEVVHISVKHQMSGYSSSGQGIRTKLKAHLSELHSIVECAKVSKDTKDILDSFPGRPRRNHRGLLLWLHSESGSLDRDIRGSLGEIQLPAASSIPIALVDVARASFLHRAITHFQGLGFDEYSFYYPRLTSSLSADHLRFGISLPLEIITSDVLPIRGKKQGSLSLYMYVRENFTFDTFRKCISLAADFADAWVEHINIGFRDFNESHHAKSRDQALLAFQSFPGEIRAFSYQGSLLSLLEAQQ